MAKTKVILSVALFLTSMSAVAQVNRYMVFFTDKNLTPHSIESPISFLSQKGIDRRAAQSIIITDEDLPVTPSYVQQLRDAGIKVLYKTKWMNGVLVECTDIEATDLIGSSFVKAVEKVGPGARPISNGRISSSRKFKDVSTTSTITDSQVSMLAMDKMHSDGFRGEGMLVAVMDAGFPGADTISFFKHVFAEGRFYATTSHDFVSGGSNVFRQNDHGTQVWSTIAAFKEGVFDGGAYKANFVLFITEHAPTEYRVEEYNWLFAAERADSLGVDVISTSLGYTTFDDASMDYTYSDMNGETTVITRASKIAANKGIAVVVSAGNERAKSWHYITAPADGSSVLAVGAVTSSGAITNFSSVGPSSDGRFKPDVAAMGKSVSLVLANGSIGSGDGTSFAGPLTASLVTGYWQKLRSLSVAALFDTIRARGTQFSNPNNLLGFGIPSFYSSTVTEVEPAAGEFVKVYPNPSKGEVVLEFTDGKDIDFTVSLVDARGALDSVIIPEPFEPQKYKLIFFQKNAGMYVLKVYRNNRLSTHKILKFD